MMNLCRSKFIDGIQHHLYEILDNDDWSSFPWRIEHEKDQYLLPIKHLQKDNKAEGISHRERLNPEDAFNSVCDSPNSENK